MCFSVSAHPVAASIMWIDISGTGALAQAELLVRPATPIWRRATMRMSRTKFQLRNGAPPLRTFSRRVLKKVLPGRAGEDPAPRAVAGPYERSLLSVSGPTIPSTTRLLAS